MSNTIINQTTHVTTTTKTGITTLGLLGVCFVVLKIIAIEPIAGWPWIWVTAPFWGPVAFILGLLLFIFIAFLLAYITGNRKK